jgi:hypothetical protein
MKSDIEIFYSVNRKRRIVLRKLLILYYLSELEERAGIIESTAIFKLLKRFVLGAIFSVRKLTLSISISEILELLFFSKIIKSSISYQKKFNFVSR